WHIDAFASRLIDKPVDEVVGSCRVPVRHDGVERIQPFRGLGGVDVVLRAHLVLLVVRDFGHGVPDRRLRLGRDANCPRHWSPFKSATLTSAKTCAPPRAIASGDSWPCVRSPPD